MIKIVFIRNTLCIAILHTRTCTHIHPTSYCPIDVFGFVASASLTLKYLTFSILFFGIALTNNVMLQCVHNCTFQHQAKCLCECLLQLQIQAVLAKTCELAMDVCVIQIRLIVFCVHPETLYDREGDIRMLEYGCVRRFLHCHTLLFVLINSLGSH